MSNRMSHRMSEYVSTRMSEHMSDRMPTRASKWMSDRMSNKMKESFSNVCLDMPGCGSPEVKEFFPFENFG